MESDFGRGLFGQGTVAAKRLASRRFVRRCKRRILKGVAGFVCYAGRFKPTKRFTNRFRFKVNKTLAIPFPYVTISKSRSVQILAYHRVNNDNDPFLPATSCSVFEKQMEFLAQNYNVLTVDRAVDGIVRNDVPENAIALTFDDGYRDNYLNAFPILKRYSLPATIFLATGVIGSKRILWHDQVFAAFKATSASSLADFGAGNGVLDLDSVESRLAAQSRVLEYLWTLDQGDRDQAICRLHERLKISQSAGESTGRIMLSWEEVGEMSRYGIHFGAHTVNHPILSRLSYDDARREIDSSKKAIENALHVPVTSFAYPVGRPADYTPEIKTFIEEAGFRCGLTMVLGNNEAGSDRYELRRIAPWDEDCDLFGLRLNAYKLCY